MASEEFTIELDFGGGFFEARVGGCEDSDGLGSTYAVYVDDRKIALLAMDLETLTWKSNFGNLENYVIQYIGEQIDQHYFLP